MALRSLAALGRMAVQQEAGAPLLCTLQKTLLSLRAFSTEAPGSTESPHTPSPSDGREARRQQVAERLMQGKSWRSWVERKLDETIAEKQPEWNGVEEAAEAAGEQLEPLEPQVDDEEELLAAFGAPPPEPQQQRQQQRQRVPPGSVRSRRRGTLEQEVFDIVFARDTAVPAAGPHVPPGLPSRYAPLVEAKDAPTLMRGGATHADSVSPARVHPHRLFYPGQNYSPQDLDPYKGRLRPPTTSEQRARNRRPVVPRTVMERADFRNPKFLSQFVSEGGKLHPRRRTQLRQKLHRHLARQVKIARIMGLMAPDAKVPQHVRASREQA